MRSKPLRFISVGLLLLVPKCSLCLFAVGTTIAVCGINPETIPHWEYALIGMVSIIPGVSMAYDMKGKWMTIPITFLITGLSMISIFIFLDSSSTFYYSGVITISLGWAVLSYQNSKDCRHRKK